MIDSISNLFILRGVAILLFFAPLFPVIAAEYPTPAWTPKGIWARSDFFPVAVWLQNPDRAQAFRAAGFNTYVALWDGPTEKQLVELRKAGLSLVCAQNDVALRHLDNATIIGWMHGDEPDNAQGRAEGVRPLGATFQAHWTQNQLNYSI